MAKHTAGPWNFKRTHHASSDAWFVITDAAGYGPVTEVGGKDFNGQIAEAKYLVTDPEVIEANARLISAAPEQNEALQIVYSGVGDTLRAALDSMPESKVLMIPILVGGLKKIRNAIAKAEGK